MADWKMELNLDCPVCGAKMEALDFRVGFIIVDGQRHRVGEIWELGCGHTLSDPFVAWDTDEDADGMTWSAILDAESGEPLLVWKDGVAPQSSSCDCEDCEHDSHDAESP